MNGYSKNCEVVKTVKITTEVDKYRLQIRLTLLCGPAPPFPLNWSRGSTGNNPNIYLFIRGTHLYPSAQTSRKGLRYRSKGFLFSDWLKAMGKFEESGSWGPCGGPIVCCDWSGGKQGGGRGFSGLMTLWTRHASNNNQSVGHLWSVAWRIHDWF
ncbi:hypothetical protein CDAR_512961 [Caerostris darwini]|uniref:Uncharacterized protein n=1 Tax=Caerostris darwini TaxID=1538125 RepID=A0AAV4RXX4_9ARAC|nr:hypothetical protein CDAR_512961 [Caerostris darwini]